jgi:hypothetical protein
VQHNISITLALPGLISYINNAIYVNINEIDSLYLFPSYYQWIEDISEFEEKEANTLSMLDTLGSVGILKSFINFKFIY